MLAFLIATGRPHRRERLCELFWDLPDDPKAALRWALSKLRKVVDCAERAHIIADRERVAFDANGVGVDFRDIEASLSGDGGDLSIEALEEMAQQLDAILLDGLDGAGDEAFDLWLMTERENALAARAKVLGLLATHPALPPLAVPKWTRLWQQADPGAATPPPRPANAPSGAFCGRAAADGLSRSQPLDPTVGLRTQRIGFCQAADDTKIAFATLGSGPPLLKAANWLSHLEFDWGAPIWGRGFAELARSRTLIRYDERGCGLSDWEVRDLSFDVFVKDLEAVVDTLGLERFPLLGISQGAAVCIEYAVRHPERVSGLILLGGYASGWRHHASPDEIVRREAVRNLTEVGWGTDNPAYRHIFSQTFMPDAGPAELAWFDEFQRLTTSPRNAARFQDAFGDIDVRDHLADVKAPTIVLHAKEDQRISIDQGRALAAGIPGARFVPLDSKNHVLVDYEPAWDTCMKAIFEFLAEYRI
ncbi:alpha/beta fold hydrolase [Roseovarius sp. CAU 1744]|uniref:alpha/beta fold hydrolase n=1 Tax=Roseovarius sp. CAU 1744 TaxID=3140368 RepID=UPI00325AA626